MKLGTASSNQPLHTTFLVFPSWLLENETHTQYSSDMAEEPLRRFVTHLLNHSLLPHLALGFLTSPRVFCEGGVIVLIVL